MKEKKLIIFDADDTIRRCTIPGQPCPDKPGEWELIPGVKEGLTGIDWGAPPDKIAYGIASNQAGVEMGYLTQSMAYGLLGDMFLEAFGARPRLGTIQMCTHLPELGCQCRKPNPLMLIRIMDMWGVKAADALFVGDLESDRQCAENAGVDFMWAKDFFGWDDGQAD